MIVLDHGNCAGASALRYIHENPLAMTEGVAFWVRGKGEVLTSSSYATCVGLALHGDVDGYGAVVHFWHPSGLDDAKIIVDRYMQWLFTKTGGYCGDDVEAVLFGGSKMHTSTGMQLTVPRIAAIREYLETRWDMRVVTGQVGSSSVALDLTKPGPIEEMVKLEHGLVASKPHELGVSAIGKTKKKTHQRTLSN